MALLVVCVCVCVYSSVQGGISVLRKNPELCAAPHLLEGFPMLPLKQFQCSSD